eukprot:gnl/Hemi2/19899_TR6604_c0_g1_i1.p1 gnl/Hemi2/19899_TR6604_c0_g1~~gnl/Hemi2/19899_TR6604_c0_g1_i1.p1  ORF type:complete len:205 (-),score=63.53 gnl/Hemi2/19899_TR6604_c0_g1_i1:64-678(-)
MSEACGASSARGSPAPPRHVVKVGLIGDIHVGKTSLMVKYAEGHFDEDYVHAGGHFMEKTVTIRNSEITFSIWDLSGGKEFLTMLPIICNGANAVCFMFDLSRRSTLTGIKEWFRMARGLNKTAAPILVGTKYDIFVNFPEEEKREITEQAKAFARAMKAPCIFTSALHSINVHTLFKIVLSKVFDLKCNVARIEGEGDPIVIY